MPVLSFHFTPGTGFFAWLIRSQTASRFAHVSMALGNLHVDAIPGHGIRYRDPPPKDALRISFPLTEAQAQAVRLFWEDEIAHGAGYDYWGVLRVAVAWLARLHQRRWFCSELGGATAKRASILPTIHDEWRDSPEALYAFLFAVAVVLLAHPPHAEAA